ncbi:MAG: hypothetical protein JXL84_07440 [Deltaproteobacteria bacterium]|nr:hypothetical protein [Deltaproteobacteria bacterium]
MTRRGLIWCLTCLTACVFLGRPAFGAGEGLPVGSNLPSFVLPVPQSPEDMAYLGLKERAPFTLSQVSAKVILIEVVSVL